MTSPSDPVEPLRGLLERGLYQEVLDHYAGLETAAEPALLLAVATAATRLNRYDEAHRLASTAYQAFWSRADVDGRLRSLNLLGAIAYERGELTAARTVWLEAVALARSLGDSQMTARISNNLGIVEYLSGRSDEARRSYHEAMLAYQRLGDRRGLAETLHNLAILARRDGALGRAADLSGEAVRHAEVLGDPVLMSLVVVGMAKVHLDRDDRDLARAEALRAEHLAKDAGDELGQAEAWWVLAEHEFRSDRVDEALGGALRVREVAASHGSKLLEGEASELAAYACGKLGLADEAMRLFREARRLYSELGALPWLDRLPAVS